MISAEAKRYVLPPVNVTRWRARFQKICRRAAAIEAVLRRASPSRAIALAWSA
jgi:hypothetical protein